jgi:hypothetical protein
MKGRNAMRVRPLSIGRPPGLRAHEALVVQRLRNAVALIGNTQLAYRYQSFDAGSPNARAQEFVRS